MRIADLHCDTVERLQAGIDITVSTSEGHIDVPRLLEGDVGLQAFAAYVAPSTAKDKACSVATGLLDSIRGLCAENDHFIQVDTADGMEALADSTKTGVLLTIENGHAIEDNLGNLRRFREMGVRSMAIVHSANTTWAASCSEASAPFDGLSEFGETVIREMNDIGMIVDVSHCNEAAFWKVAQICQDQQKPFIASHSNAHAICEHPRNLKDDQIRAVAEAGGVIGINFFPAFLDAEYYKKSGERAKKIEQKVMSAPSGEDTDKQHQRYVEFARSYQSLMADLSVTSGTIVKHIQHIFDLVGPDHLAFGSDFDGIPSTPEDVTGSDGYGKILGLLSERGFSQDNLKKIAWGNFLRVLRDHG